MANAHSFLLGVAQMTRPGTHQMAMCQAQPARMPMPAGCWGLRKVGCNKLPMHPLVLHVVLHVVLYAAANLMRLLSLLAGVLRAYEAGPTEMACGCGLHICAPHVTSGVYGWSQQGTGCRVGMALFWEHVIGHACMEG